MSPNSTPQFPLYIPSKGRSEYMITSTALSKMGVPHYIIVEPQEVDKYIAAVRDRNLLTTVLPLDMSYKDKYELCDDLGLSKSTGSGPARNFGWDHSVSLGFSHHWMMDDNIRSFRRNNYNERVKLASGVGFRVMEDFSLRYTNLGMCGPNYMMFSPDNRKTRPFIMNTRIYSCNLIRNDIPFRWRGRYNEDTILSLDMLKAGWCTVLFYAFLQEKMVTQALKGGNTTELYLSKENTIKKKGQAYADEGTLDKSKMLCRVHPDVSKIKWKFGRWHHHVDYKVFKNLKLIRKPGVELSPATNDYGMTLVVNK